MAIEMVARAEHGGQTSIRLALFFTEGVSLETWEDVGMLSRELALYRGLSEFGVETAFATYGGASDRHRVAGLPGARVLANGWDLPVSLYRRLLPALHGSALARCDVIKTNQMQAAPAAMAAARLWRKPLIVRCGYMLSEFVGRERGTDSETVARARALEEMAFARAARVIVTTEAMASAVRERAPSAVGRVHVVPNYVDTQRFHPVDTAVSDVDVLFVGRLVEQKNPALLLESLRRAGMGARLIGQGPLKAGLGRDFADLDGRVEWIGRVPNEDLPGVYAAARMFVLPSRFEGHPKTLIEAMACGCAVIATDAPGIREVVKDGESGILVPPDPDALAAAMNRLADDPDLRRKLGRAARRHAVEAYGLDRITKQEFAVLAAAMGTAA